MSDFCEDIIDTMDNKAIFHKVIQITKNNKKINQKNSFWDFFKELYMSYIVSRICYHTDEDYRSLSLINILRNIRDYANIFTKSWYVNSCKAIYDNQENFDPERSNDAFREFGNGGHVDCMVVINDIERLLDSTRKIKRYRDKRIAHRENKKLIFDVAFNDLDNALSTIEQVTIKYNKLLNQSGFETLSTSNLNGWEEIFTIPWLEKDNL